MKTKAIYTFIYTALCMLIVSACQQEKDHLMEADESASLTLQFDLTPPTVSRSGEDGVIHLFYEVKNGEMTPCNAPESILASRAGDGNTADGGGMADLKVFIVDANDRIVARKSFTYTSGEPQQTMNFTNLAPGTYTAYAYANAQGNDWFTMPSDEETDFTPYKDALLKPVTSGAPIVQNNRMPLTGKQEMALGSGNNSRTIYMLRTVGKLSITAFNNGTDAANIETPTLGEIIPQTGWVFKQDAILTDNNPYHTITDNKTHALIPGTYHKIFETLLYESIINTGFKVSITYKGASYTFQENLSDNLQNVKSELILIKRYKEAGDTSEDMFLCLNKISDNNYHLGWVPAHELDDNCFWQFNSGGKQQRAIENSYHNVFLNMNSNGISFSQEAQAYKYGGSNDYTIIGEGSLQLTYTASNNSFSTSNNGTKVQFFTFIEGKKEESISNKPIMVQDIVNPSTYTNLLTIHRNQHIDVNIIFK